MHAQEKKLNNAQAGISTCLLNAYAAEFVPIFPAHTKKNLKYSNKGSGLAHGRAILLRKAHWYHLENGSRERCSASRGSSG